ncbi:MAG: hypothetical protein HY675_23500 [Chloroflexi bacterium]|nr:hypothetical protein [Chloroflexota bacterium]
MLFHITQSHTPESCPKDAGGSKTLYDASAEGVKLRGMYGAFPQHVIYYLVEADSLGAVHKFLDPGWKRCTCVITPVSEEPILR